MRIYTKKGGEGSEISVFVVGVLRELGATRVLAKAQTTKRYSCGTLSRDLIVDLKRMERRHRSQIKALPFVTMKLRDSRIVRAVAPAHNHPASQETITRKTADKGPVALLKGSYEIHIMIGVCKAPTLSDSAMTRHVARRHSSVFRAPWSRLEEERASRLHGRRLADCRIGAAWLRRRLPDAASRTRCDVDRGRAEVKQDG